MNWWLSSILLTVTFTLSLQDVANLPNFPSFIEHTQIEFENWSKDIYSESVWTAFPKTSLKVLEVANWAVQNDYKLRPSGHQYSWSPMTIPGSSGGESNEKLLLVKTTHLNSIKMAEVDESGLQSVSVQTGTTMDELLTFLKSKGLTLASVPVLGDVTIGGVIATGSHGTGTSTPVNHNPGLTFGSLSNAIVELTAVTWNESSGKFELTTWHRSSPDINPILTSLGRIFITEVKLRVGSDRRVRCLSRMDIHINKLFAAPSEDGNGLFTKNSLAAIVNETGVAGAIFFPFTSYPWLRTWTVSQEKPGKSREVDSPYNYPFTENMPEWLTDYLGKMQSGNSRLTPVFSKGFAGTIRAGLKLTRSSDIWGWTRDVILSTKNSTVRVLVNGFVILTSRAQMQRVIYEAFEIYHSHLKEYAKQKKFPMSAPLEVRVSSVDDPKDVQVKGASPSIFAPTTPLNDRPDFDTCVWMDLTTFSKTELVAKFILTVETEFRKKFDGKYALVRDEWSKKWAYTEDGGPWSNRGFIQDFPKRYSEWGQGAQSIRKMDPKGVFENQLLSSILP